MTHSSILHQITEGLCNQILCDHLFQRPWNTENMQTQNRQEHPQTLNCISEVNAVIYSYCHNATAQLLHVNFGHKTQDIGLPS